MRFAWHRLSACAIRLRSCGTGPQPMATAIISNRPAAQSAALCNSRGTGSQPVAISYPRSAEFCLLKTLRLFPTNRVIPSFRVPSSALHRDRRALLPQAENPFLFLVTIIPNRVLHRETRAQAFVASATPFFAPCSFGCSYAWKVPTLPRAAQETIWPVTHRGTRCCVCRGRLPLSARAVCPCLCRG